MLKATNISYRIGKKQILKGISVDFKPGEFSMIVGPNGSGKSTFLRIFSGEINHFDGEVLYAGNSIHTIKKEKLAMHRAVMSQQTELGFPLTVEEVVMMGRYPHFTFNPSKKDFGICEAVMERMNLRAFTGRDYTTLSGGEKQRVQYARVLAQVWETPVDGYRYLFLDEPLNNLDIAYQQDFLQLANDLKNDKTILVAVMHDINLATQYADKILFFKDGELAAAGSPKDLVTEELIQSVFNVKTTIIKNPVSDQPLIIYS